MSKVFDKNFHGILCHDGWVRVAKSNIEGIIVNIQNKNIRVKSYNKECKPVQYNCTLHKNLKNDIKYLSVNDTVSIKFNLSRPYIVGYRKKDFDNTTTTETGDKPVSENMNWIDFFRRIDAE